MIARLSEDTIASLYYAAVADRPDNHPYTESAAIEPSFSAGEVKQTSLRGRIRRAVLKGAAALVGFWLLFPPFIYPVWGPVTSGFFIRQAPEERIFMSLEMHSGLDIAAPAGTPVRSAKSGVVRSVGYTPIAGNYVEIRHWLGFSSYYSHLSKVAVREGQLRIKWSRVGTIGSTGRSTGPHLHFELRWMGIRIPPRPLLVFSGIRHRLLSRR